ncbi:hypothetical protein I317_03582 [Kwoniella heveanensis CBS 569]|uniref:Proteasome activator PA28 C-terminal domain-containing protein n=1 Tax=Kwoniella heveanensis BCC8398 TaxID=1296120 RepID=A0A1B9GRE5_9TREE|nr:hypothetical protein I316_04629 [Kwoniella heveanensis BCC8398]OCF42597.1 hypothetical protein I317_03582 [Kwoniella heveanensis CBS 569]
MPKFGSTMPSMEDVFKTHPRPNVTKDLLAFQRLRATEILQTIIPEKITHIRSLLKQEEDPSSPLFAGRAFEPSYTMPVLAQPRIDGQAGGVVTSGKLDQLPEHAIREATENTSGDAIASTDADADADADTNANAGDVTGRYKITLPSDIVATEVLAGEAQGEETKATKIGVHWFEIFATNQVQSECVLIIIKELEELQMLCQDLKVWLELEIPVIEDGNSFGADVQAHLISQLTEANKRCQSMQNGARSHHNDRIRLAAEWAKHPNFRDYPNDRFDHFLVRFNLRTILTLYGGLMMKFEKNWSKVINPKSNHSTGGMY